jgi:hypothetical protein
MDKKELLENSLRVLTRRAGIDDPGPFHLTPASQDAAGVYIMEVTWPEGRRMCEEVRRVVAGFPAISYASCFPLLPEVVDEIIEVARPELCTRWNRTHE